MDNRNKLLVSVEGGLGNRLRGLISGIYLSEKLNLEMWVHWEVDHACGCEFEALFTNPFDMVQRKPEETYHDFFVRTLHGTTRYYGKRLLKDAELGHRVIVPESLSDFYQDTNVVYRSPELISFISQYETARILHTLRPQKELLDTVNKFCHRHHIDKNVQGVHVRQTDNAHKDVKQYIQEMQEQLNKDKQTCFFVCSDSLDTETHIINAFPDNVITFPKTTYPEKRNPQQGWIIHNSKRTSGIHKRTYNIVRSQSATLEGFYDLLILTRTTLSIRGIGSFFMMAKLWSKPHTSSVREYQHQHLPAPWMDYYIKALEHFSQKYKTDAPADRTNSNTEQQDTSDGISVISACMNRHENLKSSLTTWLECREVNEVIIIDWCSETPVSSWLDTNMDDRIRLIRVNGYSRWQLAKAYNLAARFSSFNTLCKLDADYTLNSDFFSYHPLTQGQFLTGSHRHAKNANAKHLNGFLYLYRDDFFIVNGYNERLVLYGWDDTDLYQRLINSGLKRKLIDNRFIHHLPHGDSTRLPLNLGRITAKHALRANRRYCQREPWRPDDPVSDYSIDHHSPNITVCQPISITIPEPTPRLILRVEGALANRLVALASGMALAIQTNRKLQLIWPRSNDCCLNFHELFENNFEVLDDFDINTARSGTLMREILTEHDRTVHQKFSSLGTNDIYIHSRYRIRNRRIKRKMEEACFELLIPRASIRQEILKQAVSQYIGVHICTQADIGIGTGAQTTSVLQTKISADCFTEEIQRLINEDCTNQFLVCSDRTEEIQALRSRFGDTHIIEPELTDSNDIGTALKKSLFELYLLSQTRFILGSPRSLYSEVAGRLGGAGISLCRQDF